MAKKQTSPAIARQLLGATTGDEIRDALALLGKRDKRVEIRVAKADKDLMERLAAKHGVSVADLLIVLVRSAEDRLG